MRTSLVFLLLLAACGKDESPQPPASPAGTPPAVVEARAPKEPAAKPAPKEPETKPAPKAWPRVHTPELDALRKALDLGPLEQADALIEKAGLAGAEQLLLRARLAAAHGRGIEALRLVEEARAADPRDPSVYATAAEIYASSDGIDSAAREIVRGEQQCEPSAELLRARGILSISQPGGAARGLEELNAARAADPGLPFALRALGQAHLLLGKQAAKDEKVPQALEHALASVSFDPEDLDAQRFVSECHAAAGDFDSALAVLRKLVEEGHPLESELALMEKRAGIACLLHNDKPAALAHFLAARGYGLSDVELATGARLLAEASQVHLDAGVEALGQKDYAAAEREFRSALLYDSDSLAAENHLGVALFRQEHYSQAAELWRKVLETAREEQLELPDPVHINLSEAQRLGGGPAGARATLEAYLADFPKGRWVERTREVLKELEH